METKNNFKLIIPAKSCNESFLRGVISAFMMSEDPTIEQLSEVKAAVSEAVTNCIVHGYRDTVGDIEITGKINSNLLYIKIKDKGCGIEDLKQAMTPLFTTAPDEDRAGLGFAVMENFMDRLRVTSKPGKGTTVIMEKKLRKRTGYSSGENNE